MFIDNLSFTVLRLCDKENLTYESAAELCDLSARYFGSIMRRRSAPSILTLEKICIGLNRTPNELLLLNDIPTPLPFQPYRDPMPIEQIRRYPTWNGSDDYPLCPRCQNCIDREYQRYCCHCGQRLDWQNLSHAQIIRPRE